MTGNAGRLSLDNPYRTLFQEARPRAGQFDIHADLAAAYRVDATLRGRLTDWKAGGYRAGLMTGLAWGHYEQYLTGQWDGQDHQDEAQCMAGSVPRLHGPGIPYMVPTESYARYMGDLLGSAIEAGADAIFLEEPEFWAAARYGPAFERAWIARYGAPCLNPAANARTWNMGGELQYALYTELIAYLSQEVQARSAGRVPCYVATHSLLNYAHNRIVSPLSALRRISECGGVILQVWSHTARFRVWYEGARGEQLLAVGYLEYGSGLDLVRGSDRRLWFLVDPVEDNAQHEWEFYRSGYEATVAAALLHPEVRAYEVMPWPSRVFTRRFPRMPGQPEGSLIPASYAVEVLAVTNALSDMPSEPLAWDCGTAGVGVLVADSLMFRRAGPDVGDPDLSAFYGLALPLVKAGMPVRPTGMEAMAELGIPEDLWALLLSYDGMAPPNPAAHAVLADWIRTGHALLCFGRGVDAYATAPAWWNGESGGLGPWADLFRRLGLDEAPTAGIHRVGAGLVLVEADGPIALAQRPDGASLVRERLRDAAAQLGPSAPVYREVPYLLLRRGRYVIAISPGTGSEPALHLNGRFVDLFDGDLSVRTALTLQPGSQAVLVDLDRLDPPGIGVVAASARIRNEEIGAGRLRFNAAGPSGTTLTARIALPSAPQRALTNGASVAIAWDADSRTALLRHPNAPEGIAIEVEWAG